MDLFIITIISIIVSIFIFYLMKYLVFRNENIIEEYGFVIDRKICNKIYLFASIWFSLIINWYFTDNIYTLKVINSIITIYLIMIWIIDSKYQIIFDDSLIILSILFILGILYLNWDLLDRILAMIIGFIIMLLLTILTRGAIGGGDVKLVAVLALWLGLDKLWPMLVWGFLIGGIFGVFLLIFRRKRKHEYFAYGPCLILGAILQLIG